MKTEELIQTYYREFNKRNVVGLLKILHPHVIHTTFAGNIEIGLDAFQKYILGVFDCVKETVSNVIILVSDDGRYASAQVICDGEYVKTAYNYPEARNQKYSVECHSFFEIKDGLIYKLSNYFNEKDWLAQISPK